VYDGRVILKLILKEYGSCVWTGFIWLEYGPFGEHSHDLLDSIKGGKFE
jgi:hypothetical protein